MAVEAPGTINTLNPAWPTNNDECPEGDDHIRLIKQDLQLQFPNLDAPVTATAAQLNQSTPIGLIAMWAPSAGAIPAQWALCDGNNGTPNMTDRFVMGLGTFGAGATGGSATAQVISHTHGASTSVVANGSHSHSYTDWNGNSGSNLYNRQDPANMYNQDVARTTGVAGSHTHTAVTTVTAAGVSGVNANLPPYIVLAYIMFVGP